MRFAVALPWWGYALVFASALGLAVYTYAGARLVPARRALLTALLAAALLLLVTAVLRPVRVLPPSSARDRIVPVLVDGSRSMRVADAEGPARMQRAKSAAGALVTALETTVRTEVWAFGDGLARQPIEEAVQQPRHRRHLDQERVVDGSPQRRVFWLSPASVVSMLI